MPEDRLLRHEPNEPAGLTGAVADEGEVEVAHVVGGDDGPAHARHVVRALDREAQPQPRGQAAGGEDHGGVDDVAHLDSLGQPANGRTGMPAAPGRTPKSAPASGSRPGGRPRREVVT